MYILCGSNYSACQLTPFLRFRGRPLRLGTTGCEGFGGEGGRGDGFWEDFRGRPLRLGATGCEGSGGKGGKGDGGIIKFKSSLEAGHIFN